MRTNRHVDCSSIRQNYGAAEALRRLADAVDTSRCEVSIDELKLVLTVEDDIGQKEDSLDDCLDLINEALK